MPRETSPFILGDYWLDKRRDGKSPDIWQIAGREKGQLVYRSTKCRDVEKAKEALRTFDSQGRAKQKQSNEDAELVPQLFLYAR
nr:hypothetical protein [Novosphingobium panipatense]